MPAARWRPPVGAARRPVAIGTAEHAELLRLLGGRYNSFSTAALVVAYVDGLVDFITPEAHADHVEGLPPAELATALREMRGEGADPVAHLNQLAVERGRAVRSVGADLVAALLPQPESLAHPRLAAPSREAVLQTLVLDDDF